MSLSLLRNNVEEGNILVLEVSTMFLKGKKEPSVRARSNIHLADAKFETEYNSNAREGEYSRT